MNPRALLPLLIAFAFAACPTLHAADHTRPNILILLVDDLGYGDLGVQGGKDIPTPNIDRLAAQGVRFTDGYANGSFCTPTRAALMTGRYQHRAGMEDLDTISGPLPREATTLAERLKAAGYATGMSGKWHLGSKEGFRPTERGFDSFVGFLGGASGNLPGDKGVGGTPATILRGITPEPISEFLQETWGKEAVRFITEHKDAPWFHYLAFNAVHVPVQATDKYLQRFPNITDKRRRVYAAMLSAVDDVVGNVLATLEQTGQDWRTLIIFSSDNGGPTTRNGVNGSTNTPLRGSKCETFEGGIRVPLLARWPGVFAPGTVYRQPVASMDLTATALAAARVAAENLDGVDLAPFVTGKKTGAPHEALFWRSRTRSGNHAARQGEWMFVHSTEGGDHAGPGQKPATDALFHISEDISERAELATQHPEKLAELKALYEKWSASVDADCLKLGRKPMLLPLGEGKAAKGKSLE